MFAEPIESVTRLVTLSKGLIGQGQASTAHVLELSELTEELFPQMQPGPLLQCGSYHKEGAVCTGKGNLGAQHVSWRHSSEPQEQVDRAAV